MQINIYVHVCLSPQHAQETNLLLLPNIKRSAWDNVINNSLLGCLKLSISIYEEKNTQRHTYSKLSDLENKKITTKNTDPIFF